jgi:hypothetical protein
MVVISCLGAAEFGSPSKRLIFRIARERHACQHKVPSPRDSQQGYLVAVVLQINEAAVQLTLVGALPAFSVSPVFSNSTGLLQLTLNRIRSAQRPSRSASTMTCG